MKETGPEKWAILQKVKTESCKWHPEQRRQQGERQRVSSQGREASARDMISESTTEKGKCIWD